MMTSLPHIAVAEAAKGMIPTVEVVEELSRADALLKVQGYLNLPELKQSLLKQGLAPEEVSNRIASLSTSELNQLAVQMDQAKYGGDVTGILIVVLLVVLIIYLVRRI